MCRKLEQRCRRLNERQQFFMFMLVSYAFCGIISCERKTAGFIEIEANSGAADTDHKNVAVGNVTGYFSRAGSVRNVEGKIKMLAGCDEIISDHNSEDKWIGVVSVEEFVTADSETSSHSTLLDKVKQAMLFGASAIIILAINPALQELEVFHQWLHTGPVVIVHGKEKVAQLNNLLNHKAATKVRIRYDTSEVEWQALTTLTLWSTCGRSPGGVYREWEGIICDLGDPNSHRVHLQQVYQSVLWNFVAPILTFICMVSIIYYHYLEIDSNNYIGPLRLEDSLRQIAEKIVPVMKTKKYRKIPVFPASKNDKDYCAVCLDEFLPKQRLRVLPCCHEFHIKCVDKWLIDRRTCPLCKLDIIENNYSS